eukprot:8082866-Alexandrium_andersonii.AAC.1
MALSTAWNRRKPGSSMMWVRPPPALGTDTQASGASPSPGRGWDHGLLGADSLLRTDLGRRARRACG